MKKITLLVAVLISVVSFAQIRINEVDSDQTGTDTMEFLELYSETPNFAMDGYIVVFYNGSSDLSYTTVDLTGFSTDANGYFIIGDDAISGADVSLGDKNKIQNGADAIAIYQDLASNFPDGTAITNVNLIDAIVYGTMDGDDPELLAGLDQTTQWDEDLNGNKDTESIQNDGQGGYCVGLPTSRATNICDTAGISDFQANMFQLYPNPASSGYINISSRASGTKKVSIFNVLGKQVIKTLLIGDRLDISALNSGVYIVKIEQGKASTTKKLVVN